MTTLAGRLLSTLSHSADLYTTYMNWVNEGVRQLHHTAHPREIERLILTPRHWALYAIADRSSNHVRPMISAEIDALQRRFKDELDELTHLSQRWSSFGHVLIPDTGLFLMHGLKFDELDWWTIADLRPRTRVCLLFPMVVIDELDNNKRPGAQWGYRAGYILSKLTQHLDAPGHSPAQVRGAFTSICCSIHRATSGCPSTMTRSSPRHARRCHTFRSPTRFVCR